MGSVSFGISASSTFLSFLKVVYLHVLLLLTLFGAPDVVTGVSTSSRGCPLSRLQLTFQLPLNSLSAALHGSFTSTSYCSNRPPPSTSSPMLCNTACSTTPPRWIGDGLASHSPRVLHPRRLDVKPMRMSAVEAETKQGTKRQAVEEPRGNETKEEKRARRQANHGKVLGVHVIGLSHHNAGVDVREKLAVPEAKWNEASAQVCREGSSLRLLFQFAETTHFLRCFSKQHNPGSESLPNTLFISCNFLHVNLVYNHASAIVPTSILSPCFML